MRTSVLLGLALFFSCGLVAAQEKKEEKKLDVYVEILEVGGKSTSVSAIVKVRGLEVVYKKSARLKLPAIKPTSSEVKDGVTIASFRGREVQITEDLVPGSKEVQISGTGFGFGVRVAVPKGTAIIRPKK